MDQRVYDENYCRLRCPGGSEAGTCDCRKPTDCPDPPQFTPVGMMLAAKIDQFLAKAAEIEETK